MQPSTCFSRLMICAVLAVTAGLTPGCGNIFVPKHKVLVDAISAPGVTKPTGQSYRLLAKKATVNNVPMQVPVIKACIDAALTGVGMYDAPSNVAPDVFIEVSYGTDSGPRLDPAARETFLQLSARANVDRSIDRGTGPELWDVRVGVLGVSGRPETAMPLLASVAAEYIATDTKAEAKVEIPHNAPVIASVRESAIKALEGKSAAPAAATPATAPASTTPPATEPGGGSPAAPTAAPSASKAPPGPTTGTTAVGSGSMAGG